MKKILVAMQVEDPENPNEVTILHIVNFPGAPTAELQMDVCLPPNEQGDRLMQSYRIPLREYEREEIVSVLENNKFDSMQKKIWNLQKQLEAKDKEIAILKSKLPKEE